MRPTACSSPTPGLESEPCIVIGFERAADSGTLLARVALQPLEELLQMELQVRTGFSADPFEVEVRSAWRAEVSKPSRNHR
jgi:hypothetical protein